MISHTDQSIPDYRVGTWDIDPVHSEVSFSVRHLMVSNVRGRFARYSGTIETAGNLLDSQVAVTIDATSIDTGQPQRDAHIRSADFFDVEHHPTWTFHSTRLRRDGHDYVLDGELTIKGAARTVSLLLELNGFGSDGLGGHRAGFTASTTIDRNDYGVDITMPLDGGGVVVGNQVHVHLEIAASLRQHEPAPAARDPRADDTDG